MEESMCMNGKIMHYINGKTVRELVETANTLNIQREDVVTILPEKDYYYMVYYYGGIKS